MQINPVIKLASIPIRNIPILFRIRVHVVLFNSFRNTAPPTTGADKKKENFAASSLFMPNNLALAIVVPLLENPGIRAKT